MAETGSPGCSCGKCAVRGWVTVSSVERFGNVTARKMQEMSSIILHRANDIDLFLRDNTSFSVSFNNGDTGMTGKTIAGRVSETKTGTMLRLALKAA